MITATSISGGETYLSKHLRANDYYAEGEKVEGEWVGEGAKALGLDGGVDAERFEALRKNRHPETGKKLTARDRGAKGTAFHDITFSAPKAASIAAIVGGDSRITDAWQQSVRLALKEMEKFAAVRLRTGEYSQTEKLRVTGNIVGGLFFHDASRALDPQLHGHAVLANASFDSERGQWLALQRRAMMTSSPYVREFLYHDFARRLTGLGYEIRPGEGEGSAFGIAGITKEIEGIYSQRARQREVFERRYAATFGHAPTKRRSEQFIKDNKGAAETRFHAEYQRAFGKKPNADAVAAFVKNWREPKLAQISTGEVRRLQRARAGPVGLATIQQTVNDARERSAKGIRTPELRPVEEAALMGLKHCLERASVAGLGDVLGAALKFGSKTQGDIDIERMREAVLALPGVISDGNEITTDQVLAEEARALRFAATSRGDFAPLGDISGAKMQLLDGEQREAVEKLAANGDGIAVFIGDAGTGKTHALSRLSEAYRHATGNELVALAPTTQATIELRNDGHPNAATVSLFLNSPKLQAAARGSALLIDEAGVLSSRQLAELVAFAEGNNARLVLVGDAKQHESVERGSAGARCVASSIPGSSAPSTFPKYAASTPPNTKSLPRCSQKGRRAKRSTSRKPSAWCPRSGMRNSCSRQRPTATPMPSRPGAKPS